MGWIDHRNVVDEAGSSEVFQYSEAGSGIVLVDI